MGYKIKMAFLATGDPVHMRKIFVHNIAEERRTLMYIQKLQKGLTIRMREIDKEKEVLCEFLKKLHKTTGYFREVSSL